MWDKPGWLNWFWQFLWEGLSSFNLKGFYYSYAQFHSFPYVKEGLPFVWDLSLENSTDSYLCFRLASLHSLSHFFFLYQSPSSSLCTIFGSISSNIDEVLLINPSATVFVFGDFNLHHKCWVNRLLFLFILALVYLYNKRWLTFVACILFAIVFIHPICKLIVLNFQFDHLLCHTLKQKIIFHTSNSSCNNSLQTVFNQGPPFPEMKTPPAHIHLKLDATPYACHTPIPIPHHWKEQAKASLDADIEKDIITKVPSGTPRTWCSQMIIVPKKDGTPCCTVDIQCLNPQCLC